tara:strand:+ start:1206 stop:1871 length:666 start_codon:yes stop_codon:yes gene_type:complete
MKRKNDQDSFENQIINFLKKNKNFFLDHQDLLNELNFPNQIKTTNKIVDLNAYRSLKIKKEYEKLKQQITELLKAGSSNLNSQKRILKTSLRVLNTKSLAKLIDVIVNDFGTLLACDIVNCYFTSNTINHKSIRVINNKLTYNFFNEKPQTYLNQNPRGISIFFPNKTNIIKSYILLKIIYKSDRFILAMGSKNSQKFTKDQKVDLLEYLIQVTQIKLTQF